MSQDKTPNAFERAAIPFAVFVIKSLQTVVQNLNPDPVIAAAQLPGAIEVLAGQIKMQFPSLAAAEFGAVKTAVSNDLDGLLTKLSAAAAVPADPAAPAEAA